jgi:hypothetical protein
MIQWTLKKLIYLMGVIYVILDKFVKHNDSDVILGTEIDTDFQNMSRKELCNYVEDKFGWDRDSFWNLQSTQKIRVCCQIARNNKFKGEEE